eukprot:COSAG01_NODE_21020_length_922_cov_0.961118_1_plen_192_part_00
MARAAVSATALSMLIEELRSQAGNDVQQLKLLREALGSGDGDSCAQQLIEYLLLSSSRGAVPPPHPPPARAAAEESEEEEAPHELVEPMQEDSPAAPPMDMLTAVVAAGGDASLLTGAAEESTAADSTLMQAIVASDNGEALAQALSLAAIAAAGTAMVDTGPLLVDAEPAGRASGVGGQPPNVSQTSQAV